MQETEIRRISRALLSVSDKAGLVDFARVLAGYGIALISTGGTRQTLLGAGLLATDISESTGLSEMLGGRVKTLHPVVHGGILAIRNDAQHEAELARAGIAPIDLVVANLYPFEEALARGLSFDAQIEEIDIGGVALLRAAAKNHRDVTVVSDPSDYGLVVAELEQHGGTTLDLRRRLALEAFARTATYDAAIAGWLGRQAEGIASPVHVSSGRLARALRYGENPHQAAAFYVCGDRRAGIATATQIQGKELSYNNLTDTDSAYELVAEFNASASAAVAIIKHASPCGVAVAPSPAEAYHRALRTDPVSAFGGIVALNRMLDAETAREIAAIFTEVIIAPDASDEAKAILAQKKNLRLLLAGVLPDPGGRGVTVRSVAGGLLVQSRDDAVLDDRELSVVTSRRPTERELADLIFAFKVAKHVKSNAIVFAREGATSGIGAGQMSRIDSVRIAARKAQEAATSAGFADSLALGSVVASDAFFPFADGLLAAAEAGATAVIQPGGSIRDEEVIRAADEAGLAMVFTGVRHFRH
jgi:phosphoribosylaminoimidazolecarboxamide formyltransferase/IMP cyclohydrolase